MVVKGKSFAPVRLKTRALRVLKKALPESAEFLKSIRTLTDKVAMIYMVGTSVLKMLAFSSLYGRRLFCQGWKSDSLIVAGSFPSPTMSVKV